MINYLFIQAYCINFAGGQMSIGITVSYKRFNIVINHEFTS